MRSIRWLILSLLTVLTALVQAAPSVDGDFPRCPAPTPLCQFPTTWTVAALEAELGDVPRGTPGLIAPADRLTFVYRAEEGIENVTAVHYAGQLEEIQMEAVEDSEWWVLDMKIQIPAGSDYSITLGLGRYSPAGKDIRYPVIRWSRTCAGELFTCETVFDDPASSEVPWCPSNALLCRVGQSWTLEQLRAEVGDLQPASGQFFGDESALTFVYRTTTPEFDRASLMLRTGTMDEIAMQRVQSSDWWAVTLQLNDDRGDEALVSANIAEHQAAMSQYRANIASWRGKNAPPPPQSNSPLRGLQFVVPFKSRQLNQTRDVYVYLPPNYDPEATYPVIYMSDGQSLPLYAGIADYLITSGDIPPLVMIGTAAAEATDGSNPRGDEYVPRRNPTAFERHERFFTEEIRRWVQVMYGASMQRSENILFGISNGGLFVASMSVRHPDLYGTILPFSAGASAKDGSVAITKEMLRLPLNVYATAGLLEPIFYNTTDHLVREYAWAGANTCFSERMGGHDSAMWEIEFVSALTWLYARK